MSLFVQEFLLQIYEGLTGLWMYVDNVDFCLMWIYVYIQAAKDLQYMPIYHIQTDCM